MHSNVNIAERKKKEIKLKIKLCGRNKGVNKENKRVRKILPFHGHFLSFDLPSPLNLLSTRPIHHPCNSHDLTSPLGNQSILLTIDKVTHISLYMQMQYTNSRRNKINHKIVESFWIIRGTGWTNKILKALCCGSLCTSVGLLTSVHSMRH